MELNVKCLNVNDSISCYIPHPDSSETSKAKVTVEMPHSSVKMRAATQLPVVGPDNDLTGMLLQVGFVCFSFLFGIFFDLWIEEIKNNA